MSPNINDTRSIVHDIHRKVITTTPKATEMIIFLIEHISEMDPPRTAYRYTYIVECI